MLHGIGVELPPVIIWYVVCVALGLGMFPLTFTVFRHFPDRGFALAKILALSGVTYVVWLAVSLGLTRYHRLSVFLVAAALLLANAGLLIAQWREFRRFVRRNVLTLLTVEIVFLGVFLAAAIIRMYSPDITGAEKEADFTFLNAVLHSDAFPPKDPWFAGATLNYYYGGYVLWATMIRLTGVIAPIGFNLAVITIAALSASGAFGLGYAFTRKRRFGLLAALLLVGLGNLDGLVQLIQRGGSPLPFDWWRSSRVIPNTINEFPFFSFLLGDLHAHFMSIPGLLLLLGLLTQVCASAESSGRVDPASPFPWFPVRISRHSGLLLALTGLALGGTAVVNSWDYPTAIILTGACLLAIGVKNLRTVRGPGDGWRSGSAGRGPAGMLALLLALVAFGRLAYHPFYQHFIAPLGGDSLRFVGAAQRTSLTDMLVIYGVFLGVIGLFGAARFRPPERPALRRQPLESRVLAWNGWALLIVLTYLWAGTWVLPLAAIIAALALALLGREHLAPTAAPPSELRAGGMLPYLLVFMAFAIVAGCEVVYIKDFYGHPLERQNTVFKFYYQAWIFLALAVPVLLARVGEQTVTRRNPVLRFAGGATVAGLCAAAAIYPVCATYERAGRFRGGPQGGLLYLPTLNGISYIAYRYPQEFEALMWIQRNLPADAVILEATGPPYSFFGRVSGVTGRSTVLGWGNHEALWRDQTWVSIMRRTEDIARIYDSVDKAHILDLLRAYGVEYIYVGKLERETYADEGLRAFETAFPIVHGNAFVTVYRTPDAGTP